ncbi:uncharacterized protein LAESUDRAFT_634444, partial [Laetiporus sulphureus 93-53]
ISRLPAYGQLLKLEKEHEEAIFLDIGCCLTQLPRTIQNVVVSDKESTFWELGHHLFKSACATFPVPFVTRDALNSTFLNYYRP